jgi:hypothetical protein
MALFYVTGLPGAGKSAVLGELRARAYYARGVDEDGYADWINLATGAADRFPEEDPDLDFHQWCQDHNWVLSTKRIDILSRATARLGQPVFLCGVADEDRAVWHLFAKVLTLVADAPTLEHRIMTRDNNQFGKAPEELAAVLESQAGYEASYRGFGATIIDAARPLPDVADDVLAASLGLPPSVRRGAREARERARILPR